MNNLLLFGFQVIASLIIFFLIARLYLGPALARLPIVQALTPLLLFHATRYIGLTFLSPSVNDPQVPASFNVPGAVGDLLTAFLALIALWALRSGSSWSLPLVWAFNIVGVLDFLTAFYQGISNRVPNYEIGALWFIPTFLVPAYFVVHLLVFSMLLTRAQELRTATPRRFWQIVGTKP